MSEAVAKEQQATMKAKATIGFTLHVHLDDGTTKDIPCVGTVVEELDAAEPAGQTKE